MLANSLDLAFTVSIGDLLETSSKTCVLFAPVLSYIFRILFSLTARGNISQSSNNCYVQGLHQHLRTDLWNSVSLFLFQKQLTVCFLSIGSISEPLKKTPCPKVWNLEYCSTSRWFVYWGLGVQRTKAPRKTCAHQKPSSFIGPGHLAFCKSPFWDSCLP